MNEVNIYKVHQSLLEHKFLFYSPAHQFLLMLMCTYLFFLCVEKVVFQDSSFTVLGLGSSPTGSLSSSLHPLYLSLNSFLSLRHLPNFSPSTRFFCCRGRGSNLIVLLLSSFTFLCSCYHLRDLHIFFMSTNSLDHQNVCIYNLTFEINLLGYLPVDCCMFRISLELKLLPSVTYFSSMRRLKFWW